MNIEEIREYCISKKAVTESFPFDETTLVFKVMNKMYCLLGYGDNVDKAKEVLTKLIEADSRILKDPEPFIAVSELADSSVNLVVRVWAEAANYWGIFFDLTENVYKTFETEGLNIPYPQMDVHIQK